jgi:hypothetical protein
MTAAANAITAAGLALAGVTTAVAAMARAGREHRAEPVPAVPHEPVPEPAAYVACHTPVCGHMSTPHDRTAAGLVCRGCKTTKEEL